MKKAVFMHTVNTVLRKQTDELLSVISSDNR